MRRVIAIACTLVLIGCSQAVDVAQDYDGSAKFDQYKTYAWVHPTVPTGEARDWAEMLRLALTSELNARGMSYAVTEPDVWIDYSVGMQWNAASGSVDWEMNNLETAKNSDVYMSDGGVLVIDFIDAKKDRLVWRGIGRGAVNVDPSEEIMRRNINNAVKKVMKQYPPAP